jgi:hypothetical protein
MGDDEIIADVLDSIEADDQASLVAAAIRAHWNGAGFDEEPLRAALSSVQPPEMGQS